MQPQPLRRLFFEHFRPLTSLFSEDLAIDLGTTNTRIYARGRGVIVNEPSAVAVNDSTGEVQAIGREAKEMLGRTPPYIRVVRPLKDGVIADFKLTERMLTYFIQKSHQRRMLVHRRVIISIPSEITQVEKRAVTDSAYRARVGHVHLVEQAMMAAIGAGLPINKPGGNMVVDIGGGTTDIALISMSGIVYSRSVRQAGNHMDQVIASYIKQKHGLLVGEGMAERIKINLGSASLLEALLTMDVKGQRLSDGMPGMITLDDKEIREVLKDTVATIVSAVRVALERTPPELAGDLSDRGIVLVGGGALLRKLDRRIQDDTGLPVRVAPTPLCSVVLGAARLLEERSLLLHLAVD